MGTPERLQAARLRATKDWSYLSVCLWAMIPRETPDLPAPMAVDKFYRLYYNPARMTEWSAEEMAAVLYHEANHLLRDHPLRAESMHVGIEEALQWNFAADAEINDDLEDEGVKLPGDYVTPETIKQKRGGLAEVYFRNLPPPDEMDPKTDCGSCAGGEQREWEDGDPSPDAPGVDPGRSLIIKRKVAEDVIECAKTRGSVPGQWERWAEGIVSPKVPWERELSAQVRVACAWVAGKTDYTYSRMSRRASIFPRIVMPAMRSPAPNVAVLVDTSGSMGGVTGALLTTAMGELKGLLRAVGIITGVPVIACDAAVHADKSVFSVSQVQLGGGGGTDMGVGLDHAARLKPKPEIVIVMTDMYTPWPQESPPYRTIVLNVGGGREDWAVPGWVTKVITVDGDET